MGQFQITNMESLKYIFYVSTQKLKRRPERGIILQAKFNSSLSCDLWLLHRALILLSQSKRIVRGRGNIQLMARCWLQYKTSDIGGGLFTWRTRTATADSVCFACLVDCFALRWSCARWVEYLWWVPLTVHLGCNFFGMGSCGCKKCYKPTKVQERIKDFQEWRKRHPSDPDEPFFYYPNHISNRKL